MAIVPRLLAARLLRTHRPDPGAVAPLATPSLPGLSVVLSAHNEQDALDGCLAQLAGLADEIVVLDAAISDATAEVAARQRFPFYADPDTVRRCQDKDAMRAAYASGGVAVPRFA